LLASRAGDHRIRSRSAIGARRSLRTLGALRSGDSRIGAVSTGGTIGSGRSLRTFRALRTRNDAIGTGCTVGTVGSGYARFALDALRAVISGRSGFALLAWDALCPIGSRGPGVAGVALFSGDDAIGACRALRTFGSLRAWHNAVGASGTDIAGITLRAGDGAIGARGSSRTDGSGHAGGALGAHVSAQTARTLGACDAGVTLRASRSGHTVDALRTLHRASIHECHRGLVPDVTCCGRRLFDDIEVALGCGVRQIFLGHH
jgi:hypothetical protein